jgi:hypothetical protein
MIITSKQVNDILALLHQSLVEFAKEAKLPVGGF